jgi:FAD:protein FMN transferase
MIALFWLCALLLTGCHSSESSHIEQRQDGVTAFSGQAMTMQYKILVGQPVTDYEQRRIVSIIQSTFYDTDTIFNKWNPNSELSKLNSLKAGITVPLSPYLERLFIATDEIVKLSQGKFDPTIEPIQNLWKKKLAYHQVPSEEEIEVLRPAIGWDKISFKDGIFKKEHDLTTMDFGGIAKGLCVDLMIERLNESGISHVYVEWGGEIRTTGYHPSNRLWTVYISRLGDNDPEHAISTLALDNQAIATSGDYLQNWTIRKQDDSGKEKSVTYFHIFDPKTLHPIEATFTSVASVSVVAPNCTLADGLATIPMMFSSPEEAEEWAESVKEKYPDISFWIISRSSLKPKVD